MARKAEILVYPVLILAETITNDMKTGKIGQLSSKQGKFQVFLVDHSIMMGDIQGTCPLCLTANTRMNT